METTSPPAEGDSYDEYDATLDADASLVDWAAVPLVNEPPISSQAQTPENGIPGRNSSPDTSDEYGEDVYDDAFLAQLTQLEANVPLDDVAQEPRPNAKRPRHGNSSNQSSPVSKRFKGEALQPSPDAKARRMVEGYDEELTCPLCLDFFVSTHVANPCGHSVCGPCIAKWVKVKMKKTCPICRTKLTVACPSLPNFSMDNTIEKHIASLRQTRVSGWEADGHLIQEREQRKSAWEASKKADVPRRRAFVSVVEPLASEEASGYGTYLSAHGDNGAVVGGEGGSGNTSSDEESDQPGEESAEGLTNVTSARSLRARAPSPVRLREHLARTNAPQQDTHRGERDRSRGGSGNGSGHRHRTQRSRLRHPHRRRNGRGRGGRGEEGH